MVEVYAWNPKRRAVRGKLGKVIRFRRPVNNFGDLLGPLVVGRILEQRGMDPASGDGRLLSVGSVIHAAQDGDIIWGTGVNGRVGLEHYQFRTLDVRAVRGPRTRQFLTERGIYAPAVCGDPALLLPIVAPDVAAPAQTLDVTVVPNLDDLRWNRHKWPQAILNPRSDLKRCLQTVTASRLVVGSSLHALVVAEAFGIPARAVRSETEPPLKYLDYYEGTGRFDVKIADTVDEAVTMGGVEPPIWDPDELLAAFPEDLWDL